MTGLADSAGEVPGFSVPVHRALTEHILLGGAPRSIAILNGTLAAALGLGLRLWLVGLGLWAVGHLAAGVISAVEAGAAEPPTGEDRGLRPLRRGREAHADERSEVP